MEQAALEDEYLRLRFLHDINLEIAAAADYQTALKVSIRAFCRDLGAPCGEVWVPNPGETHLLLSAMHHDGGEEFIALEKERRRERCGIGEGAVGMAWQSGSPFFSSGPAVSPDLDLLRDSQRPLPCASLYCAVPILCGDELMAVLGLHLPATTGAATVARLASHGPELGGYLRRRKTEQDAQYASLVVEQSPTVLYHALAIEGAPRVYTSPNVIRFGYTVEDCKQGRFHFPNFVHAEDRERVMAEVERAFVDGGDLFESEYRLVTGDNRICYVIDRTRALRSEFGEIEYWQGALTDITERWLAEEQLKLARERERTLTQTVQVLKVEIDEVRRRQAVVEIVDSDFFSDLTKKAGAMRAKVKGFEIMESGTETL